MALDFVSIVPKALFAQASVLDGFCLDLSLLLLQGLQDVQYLINFRVLSINWMVLFRSCGVWKPLVYSLVRASLWILFLSSFKRNLAFNGGKYVTGLPWQKGSKEHLLDYEKLAQKCLCNLNHNHSGKPDLKARYDDVL